MRAAVGRGELLRQTLDHLLVELAANLQGQPVALGHRVAEHVGEQALDYPVPADETVRPSPSGVREQDFPPGAALDQPVRLEAVEHCTGGRP